LNHQGDIFEQLDKLDEAKTSQTEALDIWRNTRDQESLAHTLVRMGRIQYKKAEFDDSVKSYTEALKIFRRLELRNDEGKAIAKMGRSLAATGNYRSALKYATEAQPILAETKDTRNEAEAWYDMGNYRTELDEFAEADAGYKKAFELFGKLEDAELVAEGKGRTKQHWGDLFGIQRDFAKAKNDYSEATGFYGQVKKDYMSELAHAYTSLGNVQYELGDKNGANASFKTAFGMYTKLDDKVNIARLHNKLGIVTAAFGKFDPAIEHFNTALMLLKSYDEVEDTGDSYYFLGEVYEMTIVIPKAIDSFEEALNFYRKTGKQLKIAKTLNRLGLMLSEMGDIELGRQYLDESQQIFRQFKGRG